jgi:hypothetical protein
MEQLKAEMTEHGYTDLVELHNGELAGVLKFMFTYGVMVGLYPLGYRTRYCFEHYEDALSALQAWDGVDDPGGPWIKRKGDVEYLNPAIRDLHFPSP